MNWKQKRYLQQKMKYLTPKVQKKKKTIHEILKEGFGWDKEDVYV